MRVARGSQTLIAPCSLGTWLVPLTDEFLAYLFDIDGTLLRPGSTIPGAVEALTRSRRMEGRCALCTNNSRMAHHAVAERFRRYGLPSTTMRSSRRSLATAQFIAHEQPGRDGLSCSAQTASSTARAGRPSTSWTRSAPTTWWPDFPEINLHVDDRRDAGAAARRALRRCQRRPALRRRRGAVAGAGAFVAALEQASGRSPDVIVGKPSITIVQEAVASVGEPASGVSVRGRQHRGRRGGGPHGRVCRRCWRPGASRRAPTSSKRRRRRGTPLETVEVLQPMTFAHLTAGQRTAELSACRSRDIASRPTPPVEGVRHDVN